MSKSDDEQIYELYESIVTTTGKTTGRLGKQIIRNLAVNIVAKKHNLFVVYANQELMTSMGIKLYCGDAIHDKMIHLENDNYFHVLFSESIDFNLYSNWNFFQTKEIANMLYKYLRTNEVLVNVIKMNLFKERYNNNNDCFLHVRLTDVANRNPGFAYFDKVLSSITYDNLFIASDEFDHEIVKRIVEKYPEAKMLDLDEKNTIQLASTVKHVVLSHGSFSAIIGYLSYFSDVYYAKHEAGERWYGDMFSIDGWKEVDFTETPDSV